MNKKRDIFNKNYKVLMTYKKLHLSDDHLGGVDGNLLGLAGGVAVCDEEVLQREARFADEGRHSLVEASGKGRPNI